MTVPKNEPMFLISESELKAYESVALPIVTNPIRARQALLNEKELRLAARLLDMAADSFADHGCNDLPEEVWDGWTHEERVEFYIEYEMWNSGGRDYIEGWTITTDWLAMGFLAHKLGYHRPEPAPLKMLLTNEQVRSNSQLVAENNQSDSVKHRCIHDGKNFLIYKYILADGKQFKMNGWLLVLAERPDSKVGEYPYFVPERD